MELLLHNHRLRHQPGLQRDDQRRYRRDARLADQRAGLGERTEKSGIRIQQQQIRFGRDVSHKRVERRGEPQVDRTHDPVHVGIARREFIPPRMAVAGVVSAVLVLIGASSCNRSNVS